MNQEWVKSVEKWLIRLAVIQGLVLLFGQILINHESWSPYLNKAIQDEGVFKTNKPQTLQTMEQSPVVWYDNYTKGSSNP